MATLYACVDESGNFSRGECCSIATCWFVSERRNPLEILMASKDRVASVIEGHAEGPATVNELKGSKFPTPALTEGLRFFGRTMYDDTSLDDRTPWAQSYPVAFTTEGIHTGLASELISHAVERPNRATTVRGLALNAALSPLFSGQIDATAYEQTRVLLDSDAWAVPKEQLESALSNAEIDTARLSFELRDSKKTPGIQFADLVAYTWRRQMMQGDCEASVEEIRSHSPFV